MTQPRRKRRSDEEASAPTPIDAAQAKVSKRAGSLVAKLKDMPDWLKNGLAILAALVIWSGLRGDISNLREDLTAEQARSQRLHARIVQQDKRLDRQNVRLNDQRRFADDIDADLRRILKAVRSTQGAE